MNKIAMMLTLILTLCAVMVVTGCDDNEIKTPGKAGVVANAAGGVFALGKADIVSAKNECTSPADCSATATVAMDSKNIVITVLVMDDKIWTKADRAHKCDSVEVYMDVREGKKCGKSNYDKGVFQLIVVPGLGKKADALSWYQGEGSEDDAAAVAKATSKSEAIAKGYKMVITLPLKGFKKNHGVVPGKKFNFCLGINDSDGEGTRCQLLLSGKSDTWADASTFKPINLGK